MQWCSGVCSRTVCSTVATLYFMVVWRHHFKAAGRAPLGRLGPAAQLLQQRQRLAPPGQLDRRGVVGALQELLGVISSDRWLTGPSRAACSRAQEPRAAWRGWCSSFRVKRCGWTAAGVAWVDLFGPLAEWAQPRSCGKSAGVSLRVAVWSECRGPSAGGGLRSERVGRRCGGTVKQLLQQRQRLAPSGGGGGHRGEVGRRCGRS